MTKIRPQRLQDIENEEFSEFASLAYAKGFLLIYGKFLGVDVSPYLEAFETSESVTVDGYAYLQQDIPAPRRIRHAPPRRSSGPSGGGGGGGGRGSLFPFVIGIVVLVVGFTVMKWLFELRRLQPGPRQMIGVSPAATASPERIVAPRAVPLEGATSATPAPMVAAAPTAVPTQSPAPVVQAPPPQEPEVRRAEPVHPQDVQRVQPTSPPVVRRPRAIAPTPGPRTSPAQRIIPRP
jgi:cytoskeletal protein RodZ